MSFFRIATIAAAALVFGCSASFGDSRRFILWGAGSDSCGSFVQEYRQKSANYRMQISWIAGFISAQNAEWRVAMGRNGIESDLLKGSDHAAFEAWLLRYCSENPLDNLSTAALALTNVLIDRMAPDSAR